MRVLIAELLFGLIYLAVQPLVIHGQYRTLTIEDDDLCSEVQVRKVKLGKGPNSGLIVRQSRLNDHSLQWPLNKLCSFKVEAYSAKNNFHIPFLSPRHGESGVFAVIQYIVFRKNETTGECIDYVQFTSHDDVVSKKYCGVLSTALLMDAQFAAFDPSEEYGGISSKSFVKVDIFISKMPLREGEEMDLNIVFTSYKECTRNQDDMRPCGEDPQYCIYEGYFGDHYVNCPYRDCPDEGGCSIREELPNKRTSTGTKVLIGSVGSLFLTFAIFVCCLWACRKHKVFCWSDEFAHPGPSTTPPARVMEMNEQNVLHPHGTTSMQPTAPVPEEDKDLPPSYESLFPSR